MTDEQIAMGNTLLKALAFPDKGEQLRDEVQAIVLHDDFRQLLVYLEDAGLIRFEPGSKNPLATQAGATAAKTGIAKHLHEQEQRSAAAHRANLSAIGQGRRSWWALGVSIFSLVIATGSWLRPFSSQKDHGGQQQVDRRLHDADPINGPDVPVLFLDTLVDDP